VSAARARTSKSGLRPRQTAILAAVPVPGPGRSQLRAPGLGGGYFLVECTHPSTEAIHRSTIVDPTGTVIARSEYRKAGLVSAVIDLDADRPPRWLRVYDPHKPGGHLPEYQPTQMPRSQPDLREAVLSSRRPALYAPLAPAKP
jgi:hypothetical protein